MHIICNAVTDCCHTVLMYNTPFLTLYYAVPPRINGFTAFSPEPTSIALSWSQTTAKIDYYKVSCF